MCKVPREKQSAEYQRYMEIIQIGAVLLDENYQVIDEFSTYVAPRYGEIDRFISRFTGIHPGDVIGAPDIAEALQLFSEWAPKDAPFITWSDADRSQFRDEIYRKHLDGYREWFQSRSWIDCQKIFDQKVGTKNNYSLLKALNLSDIDYREDIHNGLTDAYNTALLYRKLITEPDFEFNYYYRCADDNFTEEHLGNTLAELLKGVRLQVEAV